MRIFSCSCGKCNLAISEDRICAIMKLAEKYLAIERLMSEQEQQSFEAIVNGDKHAP